MDRSIPPSGGTTAPVHDDQPQPDDEQQGLLPGLLATVRNYRRVPPERAMFRELLFSAIGRSIETYVVGGFKVGASSIKLVAWSLFGRMNSAGILVDDDGRPFSRETYARDASLSKRAVRAALGYLKQARLIAVDPARGPHPELIRINIGGLEWSAVRSRIKILIADRGNPDSTPNQKPLLLHAPPRRARGDAASPLDALEGMQHPHMRATYIEISKPSAAADQARAREADHRRKPQQQQRQERDQIRIEGLIPAIAARCRVLGLEYNEAAERQRLDAGDITVDDLQAHANKLNGDIRERRLRPRL